MLLKDLKKNTYIKQKIEIYAHENKKTGFRGFMRTYYIRRIPKKYDSLKVVYYASEVRWDDIEGYISILVADCKQ